MFPPIENGNIFSVSLCAASVNTDTGYMLVDLSDNTHWDHYLTGKILVYGVKVNFNLDSSFKGNFILGWLAGVSATNGSLHHIHTWKFESGTAGVAFGDELNFGGEKVYFQCDTNNWFGPTTSIDTTWQTDVDLTGPNGSKSFKAGSGDLVCKVTRTAGTISFGIDVYYTTI